MKGERPMCLSPEYLDGEQNNAAKIGDRGRRDRKRDRQGEKVRATNSLVARMGHHDGSGKGVCGCGRASFGRRNVLYACINQLFAIKGRS